MPRTFSGTVTSAAASSNYTTYTIALATNDFMLPISNFNAITAYTNAGTRTEDGALSVGMAVNFHGLLFNDRGVLRLVCDQTRLQLAP